jgi:hypothetical protein
MDYPMMATLLAIYMENPYTGQSYTNIWDFMISFLLVPEFLFMGVVVLFLIVILVRALVWANQMKALGGGAFG